MLASLLLAFSLVALAQFVVYYWRAVMVGVAAHQLSGQVQRAARISMSSLDPADFETLLNLHDMTPGLKGDPGQLLTVRLYYRAAKAVGRLVPQLSGWTQREMSTCARYVAVLVDQRLQRNLNCAAEICSC